LLKELIMNKLNTTITFDIEAGKFEPDGSRNCKYCNTVTDANEAVRLFESVNDYPYAELDIIVTVDGAASRINLLGGSDPLLHLKMDVASLWANATGKMFVDVAAPVEDQLADIRDLVQDQKRQISELRSKPKTDSRWLPWEHVKRAFDSDAITWTRAFDMSMSECGMPMEKALQCLAEHFDRRPIIQAKELCNG
jgi:hypothetical protein